MVATMAICDDKEGNHDGTIMAVMAVVDGTKVEGDERERERER